MKKLILAVLVLLAAAGTALYLSPAAQLAVYQGVEQWRAGLHARSISVNDLKVSYYEGGSQGAETVVLVHGFGADKSTWLWFARELTERYHVIAVDLPGFGDSDPPTAAMTSAPRPSASPHSSTPWVSAACTSPATPWAGISRRSTQPAIPNR